MTTPKTTLTAHAEDYLRLRRALGFKLERAGQLLPQLVTTWRRPVPATVTSELAIAWARLPEDAQPNHWAPTVGHRARVRRATCRPSTRRPRCHQPGCSPPGGTARPPTCGRGRHRPAAGGRGALRPPLRAATHHTLFGLLAVSGMRLGEAIGLDRDDVDFDTGVITIRQAKLDRARLVPLHPSTTDALGRYAAERDRLCPRPHSRAFFVSSVGTRLTRSGVDKTLRQITTALGLRTETVHPRAHDLRHSFAVSTLIGWQRSGVNVDEQIAVLSTYLGHVSPSGHLLVSDRRSGADGLRRRTARPAVRSTAMSALAPALQAYFTDRLIGQRAASPNTIAAYRRRSGCCWGSRPSGPADHPARSTSPSSTRR